MLKFGDEKGQLKCSFCGKSQEQVRKLVAGPGVYICDECIELCNEISKWNSRMCRNRRRFARSSTNT